MRGRIPGGVALVCIAGIAVGAGCGGAGEQGSAPPADPTTQGQPADRGPSATGGSAGDGAQQAALEIFKTRCYTCHGMEGMGDGPGSAGLSPAPRNFQDPDWQAGVSDEHIANIIQYGGAAVGKSPTMPGNPDLMAKPEVVEALVAHIRSLGS